MSIKINFDADEGRFITICCLACKGESEIATLCIAHPFRMYAAAMECEDCGETIIEFDAITHEVLESVYGIVELIHKDKIDDYFDKLIKDKVKTLRQFLNEEI